MTHKCVVVFVSYTTKSVPKIQDHSVLNQCFCSFGMVRVTFTYREVSQHFLISLLFIHRSMNGYQLHRRQAINHCLQVHTGLEIQECALNWAVGQRDSSQFHKKDPKIICIYFFKTLFKSLSLWVGPFVICITFEMGYSQLLRRRWYLHHRNKRMLFFTPSREDTGDLCSCPQVVWMLSPHLLEQRACIQSHGTPVIPWTGDVVCTTQHKHFTHLFHSSRNGAWLAPCSCAFQFISQQQSGRQVARIPAVRHW